MPLLPTARLCHQVLVPRPIGDGTLAVLDCGWAGGRGACRLRPHGCLAPRKAFRTLCMTHRAQAQSRGWSSACTHRAGGQHRRLETPQNPNHAASRAGAVARLERAGGQLAWCTRPEALQAGQRAQLLYNCAAGPLGFMAPLPSPPTLILGHNGWLDTQARAAHTRVLRSCAVALPGHARARRAAHAHAVSDMQCCKVGYEEWRSACLFLLHIAASPSIPRCAVHTTGSHRPRRGLLICGGDKCTRQSAFPTVPCRFRSEKLRN